MNDQDNAQTHHAGARQLLWVALLALIVVLSVAALAYGLWRVAHQQERLATRMERLETDIRQEDSAAQGLREQQQATQAALDKLSAEAYRGTLVHVAVEADSLVRIAHYHLSFAYDIPGAINALAAAEERLQTVDNASVRIIKVQLTETLHALRAVAAPDVSQLALQLKNWSERVDKLPVAHLPAASPPASPQTPHWQTMLQGFWAEMKSLVSIRHRDETVTPLLPPAQQYFLYQNLRLELEAARLNLLRRDAQNFYANLAVARDWVKRYFDVHAAENIALLATLDTLEKTDIAPPLPELAGLQAMLRDVMTSGTDAVKPLKQLAPPQP